MADFIRGDCHKCKYETSAECVTRSQRMGFPHCYQSIVTNADKLRAMSDEELAELFEMIPHSGNPPTYTIDGFCIDDGLITKRQWLNWLKQEAKE